MARRWKKKPSPALCRAWEEAKFWRLNEMHDNVFQQIKEADEVMNKLYDVSSTSAEVDEIIDLIEDDVMRAWDALGIIGHEIERIKRK